MTSQTSGNDFPNQGQTFDQPVILRQSPLWSRAIVWAILGVTSFSILWAFLARVEEAIPAQGKLEPVGVVQPVQAPSGGVIEKIHVKEGDFVEQGDLLVSLNQAASQAELDSLLSIREQVDSQTLFYRAQNRQAIPEGEEADSASGSVAAGLASDLQQRLEEKRRLEASNQVYQAQIDGDLSQVSSESAVADVVSARGELEQRQNQNRSQIVDLQARLSQARDELTNARNDLSTNQQILERLRRLEKEGAVAELSRLQQEQEVSDRITRVNNLQDEISRLQAQIDQAQAEVARAEFEFEQSRRSQIRSNEERISAIDSSLGQAVLQNATQLQELDSRIAQLREQLQFRGLRAPVDGVVFNLRANQPGYAANSTEPILEVVPQDNLVARIYIPNKDIGFAQVSEECREAAREEDSAAITASCKPVDVRIDAFPYSEYGDIDGHLIHVGSDALPPDEVFPFYRFPAEVQLESQELTANGETYQIRSGMSLNANIKLRKRTVITFFTDLFVRKKDSFFSR